MEGPGAEELGSLVGCFPGSVVQALATASEDSVSVGSREASVIETSLEAALWLTSGESLCSA